MTKSTAAKAALSVLLLLILCWRTDVAAIAAVLQRLSYPEWLLAFVLFITAAGIAAVKWKLLLPEQPLATLLKLNFIAQFYSLLLPGQIAGEAVKAYRLGKGRADAERIAASVALDRLTGLVGLILVSLAGLSVSSVPGRSHILLNLSLITGLLVATLFVFQSRLWIRLLVRLEQRGPRCRRLAAQLHNVLRAWRSYAGRPFVLVGSIAVGAVFQLIAVLINYRIGYALGVAVPFADWCWIFGIVSIAVVLPFTIGGIGLREGSFAGALALVGIGPDRAIAISFAIFSLLLSSALVGAALEWTRTGNLAKATPPSDSGSVKLAENG
ncbi:MAG TPA: lysylphosphatidylglycerol synthase transmembrane domain-containing protein [Chthoniobacterales bacterium]|nr:lysylphosphatidylglycerol synthase transmembrane domain-containing protein [Chthoniobacterales bacterium]